MVIKTKPKVAFLPKGPRSKISGHSAALADVEAGGPADLIVVKAQANQRAQPSYRGELEEVGDIIDLGAPRLRRAARSPAAQRRLRSYTPNPRLYPGPTQSEPKGKRGEGRGRRRKRVYKRPVPNARLYRPAPPRPRPPPASPWRGAWPPPAPAPPAHALATASLAALQLSQSRPEPPAPSAPPAARAPLSRRLVVTLPAQRHIMEAAPRTPDEGSDGNDPVSAPSEFLAEFLSAIMQRQYGEALKYCRLILQYEPHNATARGFHSLLQHKVAAAPAAAPPTPPTPPSPPPPHSEPARARRGSSSPDSSPRHAAPRRLRRLAVDMPLSASHEDMEQEADESACSSSPGGAAGGVAGGVGRSRSASGSESDDSCASQSSLELDSSPSLSLSRRTDHTDSASGSGAGWESTGSRSSGSPAARDDNGNAPPAAALRTDDMQNDNDRTVLTKSESSSESLRRLRAQFACSIK